MKILTCPCGETFIKKSSQHIYCTTCGIERKKERDRERKRAYYQTEAYKNRTKIPRLKREKREDKPPYYDVDDNLIDRYMVDEYGAIIGYRLKSVKASLPSPQYRSFF
jgi:hypothetical protein